LECNWLCLKGRDFEELERIDKGLAPFTSWEDVWLVDSNSGSSSWDVKSPLLHRTQFDANSVDFIEITTLHSIRVEALAVLPDSAGLAIAVLPGRWRISAPGSSAQKHYPKACSPSGQIDFWKAEWLLIVRTPQVAGRNFISNGGKTALFERDIM
jgi:hypothetical protein